MFVLRPQPHVFRTTRTLTRPLSTLPNNPHIYIHAHPKAPTPDTHLLSYLPTTPPNPDLSIGSTTALPPTPDSLTENPHFLEVLYSICADHATHDPLVQSQAQVLASSGGAGLGSGGALFGQQNKRQRRAVGGGGGAGGEGGAGGASAQGGIGGANRGGWVHVSDQRNPPDWGRVAWPEDILGSVEVDGEGRFVGARGNWQRSGTYRVVTPEGILGLSPFLREKLVERLKELEKSP